MQGRLGTKWVTIQMFGRRWKIASWQISWWKIASVMSRVGAIVFLCVCVSLSLLKTLLRSQNLGKKAMVNKSFLMKQFDWIVMHGHVISIIQCNCNIIIICIFNQSVNQHFQCLGWYSMECFTITLNFANTRWKSILNMQMAVF